jgi:hypothetical protein
MCGVTNDIFTINQMKGLIKEAIMDWLDNSAQPLYSYMNMYI